MLRSLLSRFTAGPVRYRRGDGAAGPAVRTGRRSFIRLLALAPIGAPLAARAAVEAATAPAGRFAVGRILGADIQVGSIDGISLTRMPYLITPANDLDLYGEAERVRNDMIRFWDDAATRGLTPPAATVENPSAVLAPVHSEVPSAALLFIDDVGSGP